eukprot:4241118-Prymnesium_polylepis.1
MGCTGGANGDPGCAGGGAHGGSGTNGGGGTNGGDDGWHLTDGGTAAERESFIVRTIRTFSDSESGRQSSCLMRDAASR